jgi:uncharacterized phage protein (predicted DNA packaging)
MTAPVTLAELKLHCRVDGTDEDTTMTMYLDAATVSVTQYLNVTDPLDATAAAPIKSAIMLLAAGLYANREDIAERQLHSNETFYRLLAPYRLMTA